jgi:hypothetical protein
MEAMMMQEGVKAINVMKIDVFHKDVQRTTLNASLLEQFKLFCSLRLLLHKIYSFIFLMY